MAASPEVLFVKKLLPGGEPCGKCLDIEERLHRDGLMRRVTLVMTAREDDADSPGMELAERHAVRRAPFFVIRPPAGPELVMKSDLAFKRWFSDNRSAAADLADVVDKHPDLAFL